MESRRRDLVARPSRDSLKKRVEKKERKGYPAGRVFRRAGEDCEGESAKSRKS